MQPPPSDGVLHERRRCRAVAHGRVQGVNMRYYTSQKARSLGLSGYVRNLDDGTVEVVAEGAADVLDTFLAWVRAGPGLARVSRLEVSWQAPRNDSSDFEVSY